MAEGNNLVGVDIGTSSIKVCQIRESRRSLSLAKAGYIPLPSQTVVDGHIMNGGVVVEALNKVFQDNRIRQRDVAVSVSSQTMIIRKVSLPLMSSADLVEHIPWEAKQHIPFDLKDVYFDYEVLKRRPERGQMDVLLVAAKKEEVNDFLNVFREAKLKPAVIDLSSFTVHNVFEMTRGLPEDQSIAVINIGAAFSSLLVLVQGVMTFTRDIVSGGTLITEGLQRQLGIPFEQAEIYKTSWEPHGVLPQEAMSAITDSCDTLAAEISRSIDFFYQTNGDIELSRIFVTGGSANLPQLLSSLEERTRIPVEMFMPTERLSVDSREIPAELLQQRGAQLAVAIGLSLRKDREKRV